MQTRSLLISGRGGQGFGNHSGFLQSPLTKSKIILANSRSEQGEK